MLEKLLLDVTTPSVFRLVDQFYALFKMSLDSFSQLEAQREKIKKQLSIDSKSKGLQAKKNGARKAEDVKNGGKKPQTKHDSSTSKRRPSKSDGNKPHVTRSADSERQLNKSGGNGSKAKRGGCKKRPPKVNNSKRQR